MIRIGVIAEDTSDVEVAVELIRKFKAATAFTVRHFVGDGCGKLHNKCRPWAEQLRLKGCTVLLFIHDLDRQNLKKLRASLTAAINPCPIATYTIIIPIEEIEAWLMCDANALKRVFSLKKPPNLPGNPEFTVSPKEKLESLVWRSSGKTRRYINAVHNALIARHSTVASLRKCPAFREFQQFVENRLE